MKTIRRSFCFTAVLVLVSILVYGSAASAKEPDIFGITRIRVGFFHFSGYHEEDEEGRRSGYGYDFLQKIGNYIDCVYEYKGYDLSYSDCLDLLEKGEVIS